MKPTTKNRVYHIAGAFCMLMAALWVLGKPQAPVFTDVSVALPDETRREAVDRAYKVSFAFSRAAGKAPAFLPIYAPADAAAAKNIALRFAFYDAPEETEDGWQYTDDDARLFVNRWTGALTFTREPPPRPDTAQTDTAAEIAERFIRARNLPLSYFETETTDDGDTAYVRFIGKTGGLPDYAFAVCATVAGGACVGLEYARPAYERLAPCALRSMREAFYDLPTEPGGPTIDLSRCTLVYRLSESILQPAYLFEGEYPGGAPFSAFVGAADFGGY